MVSKRRRTMKPRKRAWILITRRIKRGTSLDLPPMLISCKRLRADSDITGLKPLNWPSSSADGIYMGSPLISPKGSPLLAQQVSVVHV